eukprot:15366311-Ditylum_brightwellii.AAC.2
MLGNKESWIRKYNTFWSQVANNFHTYYGDVQLTGWDKQQCVQVMRRVGSFLNYLGQQDAA